MKGAYRGIGTKVDTKGYRPRENEGKKISEKPELRWRIFRALRKAGIYESPKSEALGKPVWRIISAEPVFQSSLSGEGETFSHVKNGMEILKIVKNLLKNNKKLGFLGLWESIVKFPWPKFSLYSNFLKKFFRKKIPKILRKLPRLPKFLLLLDLDKNLLFYNKSLPVKFSPAA